MNISAKITGIKYSPFLSRKLHTFDLSELDQALSKEATFILRIDDQNKIATSWWVSPKRTRSYPYARVYDSLSYSTKKVTIIPIIKDEGKDGDRDFLQWDTVSLMSLLGVYVIISYYTGASKNPKYVNKITEQRYNTSQIKKEINRLLSYQSDALHWNLLQLEKAGEIAEKALRTYSQISRKLGVKMHSFDSARKRVTKLLQGKDAFLKISRELAEKAQARESITSQPKEKLEGIKSTITITNYLGGKYFFTCDEAEIHGNDVFLIEGKHTKTNNIPSEGDIKDGLLRMILVTNLKDVKIGEIIYNPVPILKLSTGTGFSLKSTSQRQRDVLINLRKESKTNGFKVLLNTQYLNALKLSQNSSLSTFHFQSR
jgi:hypothetical protein